MKKIGYFVFSVILLSASSLYAAEQEIKAGDTLQTLVNLHPDMQNYRLYSINYQQPGLIPMCSVVTVKKIKTKVMVFEYKGAEFEYLYSGHTKKAGLSLQQHLAKFFGKKCDSAAVKKLSKADREGIKSGQPAVGMSKKGIIFAMGNPPAHANLDLDSKTWMYWINKFKRKAIEFDDKGIVTNVRL